MQRFTFFAPLINNSCKLSAEGSKVRSHDIETRSTLCNKPTFESKEIATLWWHHQSFEGRGSFLAYLNRLKLFFTFFAFAC